MSLEKFLTYAGLKHPITGAPSQEQVSNAVDAYLTRNPVEPGATEAEAAQIEANRVAIEALKQTGAIAIGEVTLLASAWVGNASPYSQVVNVPGATEYSQIDLTPSVDQLVVFYEKDLTFVTENEDGVVTVYAIGQKPVNDYTIQVTIKEVSV